MSFLMAPAALAQTQPPEASDAPDPAIEALKAADPGLSETTIRDLVARLDDAEVRRLLLERLDAVAEQEAAPE
ncbi:MAG TPA: hypothetical protein EYH07_04165, partial [Kiloniellaceae bacterium]|nr:hypothetical protein [Kiloniellaceae bacterium]HIP77643.1 hypothetical protein [Kiloniellaceae bacterium]